MDFNDSCVGLKILASATNVPKGSKDAKYAQNLVFKSHFVSEEAQNTKNTYAMNKTPCPIPTILFGAVISIMYFNGMVIKKDKKEIPSSIPTMRKAPKADLKFMIFLLANLRFKLIGKGTVHRLLLFICSSINFHKPASALFIRFCIEYKNSRSL